MATPNSIPSPDEVKRETANIQAERESEEREVVSELLDEPILTATDCPTYPCDACRWQQKCEYSDVRDRDERV